MRSRPLGPAELFGAGLRYVALPFPHPDARDGRERAEETWAGVRSLAESLLHTEQVDPRPYTLGTVALAPSAGPDEREVVDGRRCLATLRLFLSAVRDIAADHGLTAPARTLDTWVGADERGRSTAVTGRGTAEHTVFVERITSWLRGPDHTERLDALIRAVRDHLRVTVVDLDPKAPAAESREGSTADLVRDLLLSAAEEQGADTVWLYGNRWATFDHGHWREEGQERPHIEEFLCVWLTMYLGETVRPERVVAEFGALARREEAAVILTELAADAQVHRSMRAMPAGSPEGGFGHRAVDVCGAVAVLPLQLWLMRRGRHRAGQRRAALRALESWIVRRILCGASIGALEGLVVELLREVHETGPERAGEVVADHLAAQQEASREWIEDLRLRAVLSTAPLAVDLPRSRLNMLMVSLEDAMRRPLREESPCPSGLSVVHVMPPRWHEHWGDDHVLSDPDAVRRRNAHVHTLGNLTLIADQLDAIRSNRPWIVVGRSRPGAWEEGKRDLLLRQSHLHLNAHLAPHDQETWTEEDIARRTGLLTHHIVRLWPGPDSRPRAGTANSFEAGPETLRADQEDGYRKLWRWLGEQPGERVVMGFSQVEEVTGVALPQAAYDSSMHWFGYPDNALARAIRGGGWRACDVDVLGEAVCFVRATEE